MISPAHPLASWFLLLSAAAFALVYALPLLLCPLRWARWFAWRVPEGGANLTVYFGRCLGGLALAVIVMAVRATPDPQAHRDIFELIGWAAGAMALVHAWGALRRIQPWTETLEIVLYAVVSALAIWLRTTLG